MDVQLAIVPLRGELLGQDAHESGTAKQISAGILEAPVQLGLKTFSIRKFRVVNDMGCHTCLPGEFQTGSPRAIGNDDGGCAGEIGLTAGP